MSDFQSVVAVKLTRKPHHCSHCCRVIPVGESALNIAYRRDGEFHAYYVHPDCDEALRDHCTTYSEFFTDGWPWLHELEKEDLEALRDRHPIAISRLDRSAAPPVNRLGTVSAEQNAINAREREQKREENQ